MVSKIDSSTPGVLRRIESARSESATKAAGSPAASSVASSRQAPAASSSLLARASQLAAAAPEIDQERVDGIKDAIARGEYHIDPEATARAFIDMELS